MDAIYSLWHFYDCRTINFWSIQQMMNPSCSCFEEALEVMDRELNSLMVKKQTDYGHGNITAFGELGVLVRCSDKLARIKNILASGRVPSNEAIEDSWMDLANYAKIALMLRRGLFTLPLRRDANLPQQPLEVL